VSCPLPLAAAPGIESRNKANRGAVILTVPENIKCQGRNGCKMFILDILEKVVFLFGPFLKHLNKMFPKEWK
jgi:hypothetical protein